MISLFTQDEFDNAKSRDLLPLKCVRCGKTFYKKKHRIQTSAQGQKHAFCSYECKAKSQVTKVKVKCWQCGEALDRLVKNAQDKAFCSSRCAGLYHAARKTKGTRKSKAEKILAEALKTNFPKWTITENDRTVLSGLELDIYIPEKKLAIEWNGILHYEPIYGHDRLERIVGRDAHKATRCRELGIELIVIADLTSRVSFIQSTVNDLIEQLKLIR
jgi:hypothetical protein